MTEKFPMHRNCPHCDALMTRYHPMREGQPRVRYVCLPCQSARVAASGKKTSYNAKWNQKHPEKRKAHKAVEYAIKRGDLCRMACEVCGETKAHAHHDNYSKPLEVIWLCSTHHRERHRLLELRSASEAGRGQTSLDLAAGAPAPALFGRSV